MAGSPTDDPNSPTSLILAFLQSKGLPPTSANVRQALEMNAREPGTIPGLTNMAPGPAEPQQQSPVRGNIDNMGSSANRGQPQSAPAPVSAQPLPTPPIPPASPPPPAPEAIRNIVPSDTASAGQMANAPPPPAPAPPAPSAPTNTGQLSRVPVPGQLNRVPVPGQLEQLPYTPPTTDPNLTFPAAPEPNGGQAQGEQPSAPTDNGAMSLLARLAAVIMAGGGSMAAGHFAGRGQENLGVPDRNNPNGPRSNMIIDPDMQQIGNSPRALPPPPAALPAPPPALPPPPDNPLKRAIGKATDEGGRGVATQQQPIAMPDQTSGPAVNQLPENSRRSKFLRAAQDAKRLLRR